MGRKQYVIGGMNNIPELRQIKIGFYKWQIYALFIQLHTHLKLDQGNVNALCKQIWQYEEYQVDALFLNRLSSSD